MQRPLLPEQPPIHAAFVHIEEMLVLYRISWICWDLFRCIRIDWIVRIVFNTSIGQGSNKLLELHHHGLFIVILPVCIGKISMD
jgi:hypothetical protein